ncbi:pyruvate dehydrogenase E2 component (dihydrolipoamide acetyltransferase) [Verrucomicrobium sp. GAS474]|uniref:pyruvate dehydrogenase complex dihydrolipoamide acetyltransferase n=1 Tax=Verrucomicrobium sp. GAS474 TaxID=1882831 RepID=UPI00087D0BE6|nr:pyruvate dehydrogenase complex dihydrolipoamide acetyltransferase [Verrucomicrobium sp. GAS474]SDT99361.1 pyruvate dehydrogenase E2 component (dihydrolipoamide acetyltransferase) [Verrucomicrobium sp. GAS474]
MAKEVTMPSLSPSMTEGTLVKWLKKEGDAVKEGEAIAEVETDKATMPLEAFDSGFLVKITAEPGAKVAVNGIIGYIGKAKDEKVSDAPASAPAKADAPKVEAKAEAKAEAAPAKAVALPATLKEVTMPLLSPSMTEGTLAKWLKKEGDAVKEGEAIAEVETDKATMPLESFHTGFLVKIIAAPGDKVPLDTRIALIGATKDEKVDAAHLAKAPATAAAPAAASAPAPAASPAPAAKAAAAPAAAYAPTGRVKASPLAKKIAAELGVTLNRLTGTGPDGRIVKRDVVNAPQGGSGGWDVFPSGPIAKEEKIPLSNMRQTIARRLLESKTTIPHFYLEIEVDAGPIVDLRTSLNAGFEKLPKPFKLSLNDFILKASAEAIRRVPAINASFAGDSIIQYSNVMLAFAVAIPQGLITPVIANAQDKTLKAISDEAKSLAVKAKDGKLTPAEYTTGTFTISNLGMFGIDRFSAIVNPPQAAILAVGNIVEKPVVKNGQIVVGRRQSLTLSCDHRVVDGAVGAKFLQELRTLVENPSLLLI